MRRADPSGHLATQAAELAAAVRPPVVRARRVASGVPVGLHGVGRAGAGQEFWQYRPYTPSDAAARIDWRQSARRADLLVREREHLGGRDLLLWVDLSASMFAASDAGLSTKAHGAALLALSLALIAQKAGERVVLCGPDADARTLGTTAIGHALDRALRAHEKAPSARAEEAPMRSAVLPVLAGPPARKGSRAVLFTDGYMDLEVLSRLMSRAQARGVSGALVQVADPAELLWPFAGRARFVDPETGAAVLLDRSEAHVRTVRAAATRHRAALRDLCRGAGWLFLPHDTAAPAAPVLLALARMFAGGEIARGARA